MYYNVGDRSRIVSYLHIVYIWFSVSQYGYMHVTYTCLIIYI